MMQGINLGDNVSYARLGADGSELTGRGVVCGIFLNEDRRAQVRIVADGKTTLNIDPPAINATPEGVVRYFNYVRQIRQRADEINKKNLELVQAGNQELEVIHTQYLGPQIVIQEPPQETVE